MKTKKLALHVRSILLTLGIAGLGSSAFAQTRDQCIQTLNPSANNALSITGNVSVNAANCGMLVNSSSSSALRATGSVSVTAKYIRVTGGVSLSGTTLTPQPQTGWPAQSDPLTFLVPPASGACDYTNLRITGSGSQTLSPGTYCNGISIGGTSNVAFAPGVYILKGGGLNADGSSVLSGDGVTFFLTEGGGYSYGPISVSGTVQMNLTAPSSIASPYYGILFYQDPGIGAGKPDSVVSGGPSSAITGVFYLPTTGLTFSGSTSAGNYLILISNTLRLTGSVSLNTNFPGGRSPLLPPISVGISPSTATLQDGETRAFTAIVQNALNPAVTWSISPPTTGTISNTGIYTAPPVLNSQQIVTVTATSTEDPTKSATATVTLTPSIKVGVTPQLATLYANQQQQFTATVLHAQNTAVTWTISPAGVGNISSSGLYTAPSNITVQQDVIITARSQADNTKSASATVTLLRPISVTVAPTSASLIAGQSMRFSATVVNATNTAVNWTITPANAGSIDATGTYTAPSPVPSQQTVTVTATSQVDATKFANATITLLPVQIGIAPATATLAGGQTQQFNATVSNANSGGVTWSIVPNVGTVSATGLYSAPSLIASSQTITVTATSLDDASKSASAIVTLAPVTITVTPTNGTLFVSQTQQFTANVGYASDTSVSWTVNPATGAGTINSSGLYTAPASLASQQSVVITATSNADNSKTASATITLEPVTITVSPTAKTLFVSQTQQFTATVNNAADTSVTWSLNPTTGAGSISTSGLYTAPSSIASAQTVTVTATSNADSTKTVTASVTLAPVTITLVPSSASLYTGQTQQFTATVGNASDTSVTWSLTPASGAGTISASGLYTVPASIATQTTVTVKAASNADPSKFTTATITLVPISINVTPASTTIAGGATQQFTATVTSAVNSAVTWSLSPATGAGTIDANGLYTAPSTVTNQQTVTVTATSQADSSKTATATLTLLVTTITISPQSASLISGQTQQFTASAANVDWSIAPAGVGTISSSGLYTAPASIGSQQSITITATSQANSSISASASVTLSPVSVTVSPATKTLFVGQSQTFTATVTNASTSAVTWSISPANAGSITSAGVYTAPSSIATQQNVTVTAVSQADSSKSATATVTLVPVSVSVSPATKTLFGGQSQQFSATVTNAGDATVVWSVIPANVGTISSSGLYTAPAGIASQQTLTIKATSQADPTVTGTATVTLLPVTITISPSTKTLFAAQGQQFVSTITQAANTLVNWSITPAGIGSVNSAGFYQAPSSISNQQTVTVTATSQADTSKTSSATVTLQPVGITLAPTSVTLTALQTQQFSASVSAPNVEVTWSLSPSVGTGTISSTGLYTAPDCIALPQTVTVIATSVADGSRSASATITLRNASGYSFQRAIVIDHTKAGSADLTNFPMLFSGTYSYLAAAGSGGGVQNANGFDIIFASDPAGTTKLDFEVESYNPATGQIVAWVRIPTLSHTKDTIVYLNYGNSSITTSQSNRPGVWESSFKAVFHLGNGLTLNPNDATSNAVTGTNVNGVTAVAGTIDGAAGFNGSRYITGSGINLANSPFTISVWQKATNPAGNQPFSMGTSLGTNQSIWMRDTSPTAFRFSVFNDPLDVTVPNMTNVWAYTVVTLDAAKKQSVYWNGAFVQSRTAIGLYEGNTSWSIGRFNALNSDHFNGTIDEVRVSNVARSADWISAEFSNQSSPQTFYSILPENLVSLFVDPVSAPLYPGGGQQFVATPTGSCVSGITWSVSPNTGSISSTGFYTVPASISSQQSITVTASMPSAPPKTATATALLLPTLTISVIPGGGTLYAAQTKQFSAAVSNAVNGAVIWSLNPQLGTIDANGLYTAPAVIAAAQNVTIIATAVADPTKSASVGVSLAVAGQGTSGNQTIFTLSLNAVADSLCRQPHVAPVVNAGADQFLTLTAGGNVTAPLTGSADSYFLVPGQSLNYAWTLSSGPAAVTFATPSAAITNATFTAAGFYTIQLSVSDGIATSVGVTHVTVSPTGSSSGSSFLITPTLIGPQATGSTASMNLRVQNGFWNNATAQITVTGANPGTYNLQATGDVFPPFSYVGNNPGTDTITGAAQGFCCGTAANSNTVTVQWVANPPRLTSSPVTGRFYTNDGTGTFNIPASQQPAFTQTFSNINFNPPAGAGNPTPVANLTRPFTELTTDSGGIVTGTLAAQGNGFQAGVATLYNFSGVFTGTLSVPSAGPLTFTFLSDDAFVFGVGNGATAGSGNPAINAPTSTLLSSLPVMAAVNQRGPATPRTVIVNFPTAGNYAFEVDYAKGGDNALTLQMLASGVPIPAAVQLTLSPAQTAPAAGGTVETFTLKATNANGVVFANTNATVTIAGPNQQTRTVTTDSTGRVNFSYVGSSFNTGTDQIQATAVINGSSAASNVVSVTWNTGSNLAPSVSAGLNQTVTLPNAAILNGSVSDDGLPSNTLTITWSKQSGPGTVTFDNPSSPATAAAFSAPGTYVLQLSASDGTLTTNSAVTITVTGNSQISSGWIDAPLNNATVSGLVPITLSNGITLTGGTLTYSPADNIIGAATTLIANTTGSGTIGTLDTTLLPNGQYFVTLNATNSQGVTQSNQVYVTVAGDYKPGRVTATVTDLTVPAPGVAIQIQRTYDSLTRSSVGDFGYGWNLGISLQTQVSPSGDVTFTLNGRRRTFYFTPQANAIFTSYYAPIYTAEPGLYGSLVNTGDNCHGVLLRIGSLWQCGIDNAGQIYSATGFRYVDPYGRIYILGGAGAIQSITDLSGNTLTVTVAGISSTNGLSVPFVRDGSGRITRITDPQGHQYNYSYDAGGNLATVTFPGIALPTQYGYDSTHLLTSEIDSRGNPAGSTEYYTDGKLKKITDAGGNVTQFAYNTSTRTTTVTNPDTGVTVTVADSYGMPLSVTDPLNRTTTYTYDTNHNQLTMTDPLSHTTTYTYDSRGFRTSLKDPLNNTWSAVFNQVGGPTQVTNPLNQSQNVAYDSNFRIAQITDSLGTVAQFTYNAAGLPLTLVDARGNTSSYQYDSFGNRTRYTDPLTRATQFVYDTLGNLTSQTDPRTNATTYAYDVFNRRTSMTDAANKITTYGYDGNSNQISETNRRNFTTTNTYDNLNRLTQVQYPDNTTRSNTYDWRGNKLTETDQLGRITKHVYDLAGQLTSSTVAFGTADAATTSYTYDNAGRKLTQTDPRSNTTTYTYDDAGRTTSIRDPIGNVTQYGYNAKGERTSMTDAKNRVTTYTYDARGRQLTTTTPDNKTVTKSYDGLGLMTSMSDEEGRATQYAYDAASQLLSVTDALNQITRYTYDPAGNKLTQVDANTHTTSYAWDNLNRRTRRTLPLGQFEQFTYDFEGNTATRVDFNGKITTFANDSMNRLLSRTPDASFTGAVPESFTYTSTGQRATMNDASGTTTYTYNNRDQVLTKATPQGTLTYTYDLSGNVASVVSSNANGTSVTYAWDANNRLESVTDNRTNGTTSYTYDATNQVASFSYPNSITHAHSYDSRDRTTLLSLTGPGGAIASYTQTYSFSGRKTTIAEGTGRTGAYGYDAIYRLLGENITGAFSNGQLTYSLDSVGNRLSLASTLAELQSQGFTYDANNRTSGDTFDANGNTLLSGGITYTYDFQYRLMSASAGVQIVYDADGNRTSETAVGVTTKFLVDTQTPTGYAQVTEEVVNGLVAAQFSYGLMRISQNRAAAISYYGYDAGGSVRQLMDGAGIATGTYVYDAFGNTVTQTGSVVNPYQYRGEHYDPTLQMYYLRARWYRPQLGRFLTEDLDEGDEDDPSSLHAYLYANADPVNGIDPSGFANTMEGSILSRLSLRTVFADFSLSMRGVSLGGVRSGAKLAYETICCIDRAWSVLGSALDFIAFVTSDISIALPTQQALDLIDEVCKIGSNVSAFARRGKGRKGERRWAGKPSGTQNPRKKWKKLPDGRWQGKDQDGKTVIKPRDWDPPVG